jgi:transposase InsO family protein
MNERVKFIARYLAGETSMTELCEEFGISRKCGYKWVERYEAGGAAALEDKSRAPLTHPHAFPDDIVDSLVVLRREHPTWGARKLLAVLERRDPEVMLPAPSTVNEMLSKRGLLKRRRRRRRNSNHTEPLRDYNAPNAVWCADFKGHFEVAGQRCHPLTVTDGYSRFLLGCRALLTTRTAPTKAAFELVFREHGLPDAIRTDNGVPFSSLAIGGLSPLAVWWLRLGIRPERILPGHPEQNGRHERMHRTLKAETARPARTSFRAQQRRFDEFREEYNHERPHEAIGQRTPGELYRRSSRPFPRILPEPEYPSHFIVERAYETGAVRVGGLTWYISTALRHELIGLEPLADYRWRVHFGPLVLGILDPRHTRKYRHYTLGHAVPVDGAIWLKKRKRLRKLKKPV